MRGLASREEGYQFAYLRNEKGTLEDRARFSDPPYRMLSVSSDELGVFRPSKSEYTLLGDQVTQGDVQYRGFRLSEPKIRAGTVNIGTPDD